jgi:hypothetical protein
MSTGWVLMSVSRFSGSGGQFPAEEVFKHFVVPVPPYDDQFVRMSREVYFDDLLKQGLIEHTDDENAQVVNARTNPRVCVHGMFEKNGTFVIRVVESDPPPTSEPWRMPKVGIAFLRDGMYSLRLPLDKLMPLEYLTRNIGYSPGNIKVAGEPSEVCLEVTLYRRVWRVYFGLHSGRPRGSGERFEDAEDFRQTVITDLCNLRRHGHKNTQLELARLWYGREDKPTAEVDSLVTEIKRYCRDYKLPWKVMKEESRHR